MHLPTTITQEPPISSTPPSGRKVIVWAFLTRVALGAKWIKGWIFRGGDSRRLTYSVGKRDSCEMRKLCGGHDVKK